MVGKRGEGVDQRSTTRRYQEPQYARIGHGWDRETIMAHIANPLTYDEFDDADTFTDHIDELVLDEDDFKQWQDQQEQVKWYVCGHCKDEIAVLEEQGDTEAAAAIDPEYTVTVSTTERPLDYGGDATKRVEKTLEAYCDRHRDDGEVFAYTQSQLDERNSNKIQ